MGCIVNGPGESKAANIGISLPGNGEAPVCPVFVDGGIRETTVGPLADAGTDGVIPGSMVFGDSDPCAAIRRLHSRTLTPDRVGS